MSDFNNPWDDNSNKKGKKPGQDGDEFDEMLRKGQEKIIQFLQSKKSGSQGTKGGASPMQVSTGKIAALIIAIGFLAWLSTGFYTIQPDEEGVVMRFGKYERTSMPGLNYKFPSPIETVTKVSTTMIHCETIGFRPIGSQSGRTARFMPAKLDENDKTVSSIQEESQMLTEDENILDINFDVQWRIKDPRDYLFNLKDSQSESTVKSCAESAMREVIGLYRASDALTQERSQIEQTAKKLLQDMLNKYKMGVQIERLQMLRVQPPLEVLDAYRDVQSAKADKEKLINEALAYRNSILPRARGEAETFLQNAEGYKQEVVANAQGAASRFNSVYNEYQKAKDVTRKRIYIETMESILAGMDKVVIDSKSTAVPYISLNELLKKKESTKKSEE